MEKGERERSGEKAVVGHTVYSHHYKLVSGSQALLHII